jgi:hypothetical protein
LHHWPCLSALVCRALYNLSFSISSTRYAKPFYNICPNCSNIALVYTLLACRSISRLSCLTTPLCSRSAKLPQLFFGFHAFLGCTRLLDTGKFCFYILPVLSMAVNWLSKQPLRIFCSNHTCEVLHNLV